MCGLAKFVVERDSLNGNLPQFMVKSCYFGSIWWAPDGSSYVCIVHVCFTCDRLTLPGALVEDGRETANYDSEKGNFSIY